MSDHNFCLKWEEHHSSVTSTFEDLRLSEEFVDITLACEGREIGAHRVVLSSCSPYFREVLKRKSCQQLIFYLKDTSAHDLYALVEFMYKGSVNVAQSQLAGFMKTAEALQIRGLCGDEDKTATLPPPPIQRRQPAAVVQEFPTFHRRSAPASQEHRLPPPSLPVPSPPAKRRRHVSSEFMAAVPISASAPSVISTPSDTELNNVTSAPSAVDSSDAAASPWEASAPEPTSPTSGASNQSAISPDPHLSSPTTQFEGDRGSLSSREQPSMKTETVKVETIDVTEEDDDVNLEATFGQLAHYEGYDPRFTVPDQYSQGQSFSGDHSGFAPASTSQIGTGEAENAQGVYRCTVCQHGYSHPQSLKHHMKTHQGLTVCGVCGQRYSMVHNLRAHMRNVHRLSTEEVRQYIPTQNYVSAGRRNSQQ